MSTGEATRTRFVFHGISSEYVLGDFCAYLRARGHECIEINQDRDSWTLERVEGLRGPRTAFLTSHHPDLNAGKARVVTGLLAQWIPDLLSPLEILDVLRPALSVFVPHDIMSPLILDEWKYLDLFDLYFDPLPHLRLCDDLTRSLPTGWIKYHSRLESREERPGRILLLPSMISHLRLRYGVEGFVDYFAPCVDERVDIKLPEWNDIEALERAFRTRTRGTVLPASRNTIACILEHEIVISNGTSSTLAEAYFLGKKTVCLESEEGLQDATRQRRELLLLEGLNYLPYGGAFGLAPGSVAERLLGQPLRSGLPLLKRFDFESAEAQLLEALAAAPLKD